MADTKISALPAAASLTGGEILPVVQGGETRGYPVPTAPLAGQGGGNVAITGGAIDGVTLGATETPIGSLFSVEVDIGHAGLASATAVDLIAAEGAEQYKIRDLVAAGAFTDFSGGSGDRDISITDGTSTWSILPAAQLASLAVGRWGGSLLPWPVGEDPGQASAAGQNIQAVYSGGAADYTAGALTLIVIFERIA